MTRYYTYNEEQELCRTTEPETGATLLGYDAAGNLAWSASGLPANTPCDDASAAARKSTRTYDNRNRLTVLEFADDIGEQVWTYTPDSLPATVWTYNGAGRTLGVYNAYSYNSRRMLGGAGESLHLAGWYTWSLGYGYDRNGFLTVQNYPDTSSFTATVNALGQTTGITGTSGTYVSGASYFPNGTLKQFTYGNGIVHTLTQNARGLPDRSMDAYGGVAILDDGYDYDFNGNVASISDGRAGASPSMSRTMTYDGLDRLTSVASPMFNGTISYTYDVLDNIETLKAPANNLYSTPIAARDLRYCYDSATNRLHRLRAAASNCSTGSATAAFEFDEQGNIKSNNARGYLFSFDNRLRQVSDSGVIKEIYRYDANGRRVTTEGPAVGWVRSYYNKSGQLSFQADDRTGKNLAYVYLGGSLVATREQPTAGGAALLKFHHTDALGSPVAVTNASRSIIETSKYEPYGSVINRALRDGHGYTGHIEDAQTGLNYMQQRYFDPGVGLFLSVDPVTATSVGGNFNRYWYANNNPYLFTDPDGRQACSDACMKMRATSDHGIVGGLVSAFIGAAMASPPAASNVSASTPPNPNGVVPGGPWEPRGPNSGDRKGSFQGPKPEGGGPRQIVQWVPRAGEGGPPGSVGYWKQTVPGGGWQRYDQAGKPITAEQAHPRPAPRPEPMLPRVSGWGRLTTGLGLLLYSGSTNDGEAQDRAERLDRDWGE